MWQLLPTVIIAVIVAYIAWQQYQVNLNRLKLDLLDRRMEIYDALSDLLGGVFRHAKVNDETLLKYRRDIRMSEFLYRKEFHEFLDEFFMRGIGLAQFGSAMNELRGADDPDSKKLYQEAAKQKSEALKWVTSQGDRIQEMFRPYLTVTTPRHPWN